MRRFCFSLFLAVTSLVLASAKAELADGWQGGWYSKPVYADMYGREVFHKIELSSDGVFTMTRYLVDAEASERTLINAGTMVGPYSMRDGKMMCHYRQGDFHFSLELGNDGVLNLKSPPFEGTGASYFRTSEAAWSKGKIVDSPKAE